MQTMNTLYLNKWIKYLRKLCFNCAAEINGSSFILRNDAFNPGEQITVDSLYESELAIDLVVLVNS